MKLNFRIEYRTVWGENLVLCVGAKRYPLSYIGDGVWHGEIERVSSRKAFEYTYELERDSQVVRREWKGHTLVLPAGSSAKKVTVYDRWNERPADAPLFSTAFTKAIFSRPAAKKEKNVKGADVVFQVNAADVRPGEVLALAGSGEALGDWSKIIPFDDSSYPLWSLALNVSEQFAYKIIVADRETLAPVRWEEGENRWFGNIPQEGEIVVDASAYVSFNTRPWKGAGTAIPVFSIRTEDSFGVGEFYDLKKMVDWASATGQVMLQLLPINDTTMYGTWEDSYPYNPNSTFALHPQYLHLPAAGVKVDEEYKAIQQELNSLPEFDYEKVNHTKIALLRKAFSRTFKKLSATESYQSFMKKNASWLLPYAAFCVLRDLNHTPDFSKWKDFSKYGKKKVAAFCEENRTEVDFWCFVQYHLDNQLSQVCSYAHSKGVVFKGDLPIGISRTSVDAWLHPELFHMDSQAGAPPDAFSADGQNWGFPTYNWEKMAEDDYAWWKARLAKMSEYFDAFRIDHILGFSRMAFDGLYEEFFYHRNNEFWKEEAMKKLPALLDSTGMLACGEDLGMIPATVPQVMSDLRILSLEIQRMPKIYGQEFADPAWYPYLSVCTTSTHDMNPVRAWWEEDRRVTESYYRNVLGGKSEAPLTCEPQICRQILEQHLKSPAMLTVLPLQDWLSMDESLRRENPHEERINQPAVPRHYWRYRMHLTVEQLISAAGFNATISEMIAAGGRTDLN